MMVVISNIKCPECKGIPFIAFPKGTHYLYTCSKCGYEDQVRRTKSGWAFVAAKKEAAV